MDVFTGQQIEINGDAYIVEDEPVLFRGEYRVLCKAERGTLSIILSSPDLSVLRGAISRYVVTTMRKRRKRAYRPPPKPR